MSSAELNSDEAIRRRCNFDLHNPTGDWDVFNPWPRQPVFRRHQPAAVTKSCFCDGCHGRTAIGSLSSIA
jgi:hypothetical protein